MSERKKVFEAPISHEMEPHCCGCWIFWADEGDFYAECNECSTQISIIELLAAKTLSAPTAQGSVSVPREPTQAILWAMAEANVSHEKEYPKDGLRRSERIYRAMLAALAATVAADRG